MIRYPLATLPRYFKGTMELWFQADLTTKERATAAAFLRSFEWPAKPQDNPWWYVGRLGLRLERGLVFRRVSQRAQRFAVVRESILDVQSAGPNPHVTVNTNVNAFLYVIRPVENMPDPPEITPP